MVAFLRFVGLLNASVWLGAAVFFTLGVEPTLMSSATQGLLQKSFPYYAPLLVEVVRSRFLGFSAVCGGIALLHLMAEWLYFGRPIRRFAFWLPTLVLVLALFNNGLLARRLKQLHSERFVGATPVLRQAAQNAFSRWEPVSRMLDLVVIAGVTLYLLRMANPPETLRFVGPSKFHS